jgi:hypothetical protein
MTQPEEDVDIGATTSPAVGVLGVTSDVFDAAAAIGEVFGEESSLSVHVKKTKS